jgi:hypothetical protein
LNTFSTSDLRGLGLGQVNTSSLITSAIQPYVDVLKTKLTEIAGPTAKAAAESATPIIQAEFKKWIPLMALIIGGSIFASILIGTQLPRWKIGG